MTDNHAYVRTKMDVSTWDGKHENRATITAYAIGETGLSVHRTWASDDGTERTWDVTHARTGLRIGSFFPSRQSATEFAHAVLKLADWNLPGVTLIGVSGLASKVEALTKRYRGVGILWVGARTGTPIDLNEAK